MTSPDTTPAPSGAPSFPNSGKISRPLRVIAGLRAWFRRDSRAAYRYRKWKLKQVEMKMKQLVAILAAAAAFFATPMAFAHATIEFSNIEQGGVYESAPETLQLIFHVDVGLVELTLQTVADEAVALDYRPSKAMQKAYEIPLPALGAGGYVIRWRTIAKDGHVMAGTIEFSIE